MTDPSKRYWITEQGMKELAEDLRDHAWLNLSDPSELDCVIDVIAAHSEAASPPNNYEAELRHAVLCMNRSCKRCNKIAKQFEAAAPPQGTPGIETEANSHPEDGGPKEIAWEAQGSVPNLDITPGGKGKCVSCGTPTIYICPFCKIKGGKIRWLCERPECRDAHETVDCARTPSSWGHSTVAAQKEKP